MAAASGSILQRCIVSPAGRHSASLIFLHGSGDSGRGLRMWIKQVLNQDLTFQHIKIIYPTAPPRSYTPMKGGISNVWFDRFKISNDCPEHLESIDVMCQVLTDLIDDEVKSGIKKNRILIEMTRVDKPGSIPNNKRKSFNKSPLNMLWFSTSLVPCCLIFYKEKGRWSLYVEHPWLPGTSFLLAQLSPFTRASFQLAYLRL
ncbi:lysophospholipase-like protein 1 isoform X3 [Aotus nancymaae]|uniref:lysophospholipase-like protein 1 isoform X3 n=1 Tax=Aotus nancymaae TaxID=37293 RepID=UPI0030FEA0A3